MIAFERTLKVLAVAIFGISALHILVGVASETLLGSGISATSILDPNLDSQNRFYGAAFALFGVVWWLASANVNGYQHLLRASFLVFFLGGVARVISVVVVGWPTLPVIGLTVIELVLPWVMILWLKRVVDG